MPTAVHHATSTAAASRRTGVWLWLLAFVLMVLSAGYQRMTGPTFPYHGKAHLDGGVTKLKLPRSATSNQPLKLRIAGVPYDVTAWVTWKPKGWQGDYTYTAMQREGDELVAQLPGLPPGVKIEYRIRFNSPSGPLIMPPERDVILRFKGAVPAWALIPHVLALVLAVLFGLRTLLEALWRRPATRAYAWAAFWCMIGGGMLLGPLVQWYAFGAWWTGIPFGWDVTDNKVLFMLICWIGVLLALYRHAELTRRSRRMVIVGAVVMLIVYLIPHSLFGTEVRLTHMPDLPAPASRPAPPL